jgi:cytochrome b
VFHWGVAASVCVCVYTGFLAPRNALNLHLSAGAAIAGLVCFRLVWGRTGSTYALFSSFAVSPHAMAAHLRDIVHGRRRHYRGHTPLGAAMTFALFGVLILLAATGVIALGGDLKQGPLRFATTYRAGSAAREAHEWLAFGLLGMVAAHLAGVAFESWFLRENLVRAMLTGRKPATLPDALPSRRARPLAAALTIGVIVAIALPGAVLLSALPARGVPADAPDPAYARECGGCHFAYPPSLAPAPLWDSVMGGLADHFGENASLDAETAARLRAWLAANAAERWDTRAANMFRRTNPLEPQRITAAPAWMRLHRDIAPEVFRSAAVGAKGACGACHQDAATGRFDPQSIAVPKDARS